MTPPLRFTLTLAMVLLSLTPACAHAQLGEQTETPETARFSGDRLDARVAAAQVALAEGALDDAAQAFADAQALARDAVGEDGDLTLRLSAQLAFVHRLRADKAAVSAAIGGLQTVALSRLDTLTDALRADGELGAARIAAEMLAGRAEAESPAPDEHAQYLMRAARILDEANDRAGAEALLARAIDILDEAHGTVHDDAVDARVQLAPLVAQMGRSDEALALLEIAHAARLELDNGAEGFGTSDIHMAYGRVFTFMGDLEQAEQAWRNAVELRLAIFQTEDDPLVLQALAGLGPVLERRQLDDEDALAMLQFVLPLQLEYFPTDRMGLAQTHQALSRIARRHEQLAAAELHLWQAIGHVESNPFADPAELAVLHHSLAGIFLDRMDFAAAEFHARAALAYQDEVPELPAAHRAHALRALASALDGSGDDDVSSEVLELYREVVTLETEAHGTDSVPALRAAIDLTRAELLANPSDDTRAAAYEAAVDALLAAAPDSETALTAVGNRGTLRISELGDLDGARQDYELALEIASSVGDGSLATPLHSNLAEMAALQGDVDAFLSHAERVLAAEDLSMRGILTSPSDAERELRIHFDNIVHDMTGRIVAAHMHSPDDPRTSRLALQTLLRRRGLVLEALTARQRALRDTGNEAAQLLDDLGTVDEDRFRAALDDGVDDATRQALDNQSTTLQRELAMAAAELLVDVDLVPTTTVEAVAEHVPDDALLIEFVELPGMRVGGVWGEPRFVAVTLDGDGESRWVELGEAQAIEQAVSAVSTCVMSADGCTADKTRSTLQVAYQRVLEPVLRDADGTVRRLFIVADGALHRLPFDALATAEGVCVLETHEVTMLSSGRALLRARIPGVLAPDTIVAAPDYVQANDAAVWSTPTEVAERLEEAATAGRARSAAELDEQRTAAARLMGPWRPLPGTAREAAAIVGLLGTDTRIAHGAAATEALVTQELGAPRVLHLATHGFFLGGESRGQGDRSDLLAGGVDVPGTPIPPALREDPMLRAGLVLAGADGLHGDGAHDGILTAREIATRLDLQGTRLAVLSACETGVGEVRNGQGIYGLQRAFELAGVETLVMSLWQVDDAATAALMTDYYAGLAAGQGRSQALRAAKLALLASDDWSHPYYWSAFIVSGDHRTLDGGEPADAKGSFIRH